MTDEQAYLCCMPTVSGPPAVPSTIENCIDCGTPVWVSHLTFDRLLVEGVAVKYICLGCSTAMAQREDGVEFAELPGQREDIQRIGGFTAEEVDGAFIIAQRRVGGDLP